NTAPSFWEPREVEKGDVARMILYMAVRYEGTDTTYDLELQDVTPTTGPFYGKLSTLLAWHEQDPPDAWEQRRNDRIQERQGNRNPFIDHPEFVSLIWYPYATGGVSEQQDYFTASWAHSIGAQSYRVDVSTSPDFDSFLYQDTEVGDVTAYEFHVPDQDFVYYRVRAFLGSGYSGYSNTMYVNLTNNPSIELTSFTAASSPHGFVNISWVTNQESNLMGFGIYRSNVSELSQAQQVNLNLIPATNTSQTQHYTFQDYSLTAGGYYYYWLEAMELSGYSHFFGPVMTWYEVDNADPLTPVTMMSTSAWPNPFSSQTTIKYDLPATSMLKLGIYNARGQLVRTLVNEAKAQGSHQVVWDGRDPLGRILSPGVYLYRLQAGKQDITRKLMLK
ncbi:MAG TPA: endonuclease, partial [Candidatus Cloacimonadota bacterium]|nr:endonuclease [Candidatus Cloacimonadota bacterium]